MGIKGTLTQRGFLNPSASRAPSVMKETPFIQTIEVPTIKEVPVVQYVDRVIEKEVEREVPTIQYVDREVIKYVDREVEVIKEVVNYVDREVEKIVEKEKEVVKEVPVFMDRIVTRVQTHRYVWIALGIQTLVLLYFLGNKL